MTVIAPNRADQILDEDGRSNIRFAQFLEDSGQAINDLLAKPVNTQDSSYTFILTDAGSIVRKTSSTTSQVYTIPANTAVEFDIGSVIEIQNDGTKSMQVAIATDTLTFEADNTTGTRTIAAGGSGRFVKVAATNWKCRGQQMT